MRKKICIGLLAVLLGTGLGAMLVNHIWKEPKQGVDLGATQMIVKDLTVQTLGQVSCSDSVKENLRESGKDIKIPVLTVDIKNPTKDWQSLSDMSCLYATYGITIVFVSPAGIGQTNSELSFISGNKSQLTAEDHFPTSRFTL